MSIQFSGGGVISDISGLTKPAKFQPIIRKCRLYIDAMDHAKRPIHAITMGQDDYDSILKSLQASAKKHSLPDVVGIRFHEIPVKRAE